MRKVKILLNGVCYFYSPLRFTAKRVRRRESARVYFAQKQRAIPRESPTALHDAAGRLLIVLPSYCVVQVVQSLGKLAKGAFTCY